MMFMADKLPSRPPGRDYRADDGAVLQLPMPA
jgi:hypothetical protein